ncbi:metal ABC transporter solute-binding protein, Zn/Mn family [Microbacterium stercoris]|uniref:Zinc ABC transporter substrate-binding protein n=1 Tax=Microbacterium stercoris TaxID=2820289 RepID=A0A939QJE1_9MICO|nr:zinc ABC transporter substrate-binding protein [Microbacterium stercoris]MBO3662772.1 zinc ABC transporter substrate-binding protein [Microbacterium stercoris]
MSFPRVLPVALLAVSTVALAGCSGAAEGAGDGGGATIVASTNVYAQIAQELVGDGVEVASVIDTAAQDPHAYEASARDRLLVQDAKLVIQNGGGYDGFMEELVADDTPVITAVEFSHDFPGAEGHEADHADEHTDDEHADEAGHEGHDHIEGFNEHVWYDVHTMIHVVEGIAEEIGHELPDLVDATELADNRDALVAELEGLEGRLDALHAAHEGEGVFLTEPIGGYLAASAGLDDVTPEGFAESVEEGQDVPPATLLDATRVIEAGDAAVILTNAQTGGAETERVIGTAEEADVPVVELSELLQGDETYVEWMADNVTALEGALAG